MENIEQNNTIIYRGGKNASNSQINTVQIYNSIDFQKYFSDLPLDRQKSRSEYAAYIYDTCPIKLYGREKEFELLNSFVKDDGSVLWWAITGLPGSGKTRLAYEFINELNKSKDWVARFIPWNIFFNDFEENVFNTQNVSQNFFFVIDYMYAYEEQIAKWIAWLTSHFPVGFKLRILVIEREYAIGYKSNSWEEFFKNGFTGSDAFYALKYKDVNLNLNSYLLSPDNCINIVNGFCESKGETLSDSEIYQILTLSIKANNNKPTPLLLMIFTEYFLNEKQTGISINPYENALSRIANREKEFIYKTIGVKDTVNKLLVEKLVIISTILGEIDLDSDFNFLLNLLSLKEEELKELLKRFSETPLLYVNNNKKSIILGVTPDLIGEYLIYDYFKEMNLDMVKPMLDSINSQ